MAFNRLQPQTAIASAGPVEPRQASGHNDPGMPPGVFTIGGDDDRYYVADRGRTRPVQAHEISPLRRRPLWKRILRTLVGRMGD